MKTRSFPWFWTVVAVWVAVLIAGCAHMNRSRESVSSSLVDFLYPKGELPPAYDQTVPNLPLPLNVGIGFVPESRGALSEPKKNELLIKAKAAFLDRPFINQIVLIPDAFMRSGKGFGTLDQIARLFNLDVIALVSYDQVANTDQTNLGFLYWTIVGAYTVPANRHEVRTFVDTAVFDVRTHKLLFHAPGVAANKHYSTYIGDDVKRRVAMEEGFDLATVDMIANLGTEIDGFKERIKQDKSVKVSYRPGFSGSGALDAWMLLLLAPLAWGLRRARR
ncbi:delta endotoxin [Sulfurifustis variabilis]|uniref:Delta endotoxin n=1 Tax=Sulfurifustis variabilis TaxID=1675686 RepID=A0A1B4VH05_9GAMM|nr:rhombotarget lipoprotein [Sulfurifustis variabilis]BAU50287.1 delta endotoxin [Sulfurifustis variabilis]